jgi:hypothetical protein
MTFLQLCKRLRMEAGIPGTGPITAIDQSGEIGRIVDWVSSAYEDIQNLRATWKFLRTSFTFSTMAAKQNYTLTDVSLTDLAVWKTSRDDDLTIYSSVSDEQYLIYCPWDVFKGTYLFGTNRTTTGRPTIATIKPDNSMSLWPIPNTVFTVIGEYYKKAQTMAVDSDEPLIPSQFHIIIVWKALMYYGAYSGSPDLYTHGEREYKHVLRKLEKNQLPAITWGTSLV